MTNQSPTEVPRYEGIAAFGRRSGMSTTAIYAALGEGHLRAIKLGRKTVIDVEAALAWVASQPRWTPSAPVAPRRPVGK